MMRAFGQISRFGCGLLAVAMAVQGLTPDACNLASTWLLRQITPGTNDAAGRGPGSLRPRVENPLEECVPGVCEEMRTAGSLVRWRDDDGGGPSPSVFDPDSQAGRCPSWDSPALSPASGKIRDDDRLFTSLCKLRC